MATNPFVPDVVRARRFELVDVDGTVRAQLGRFSLTGGDDPDDDVVGIELFGASGSAVSLLAHRSGAQLSFEVGGNQVLILEAFDRSGARDGGSTITVCDRDGVPAVRWRVDLDGTSSCERPDAGTT
ncbi:MAG: hypothetical protein AB7H92_03775 [Microbacteriaceae bacterium]